MTLSKEQFVKLRNQGLSVSQITKFEKRDATESPETKRMRLSSEQAQKESEIASSPSTIAKETIKGIPKKALEFGKEVIAPKRLASKIAGGIAPLVTPQEQLPETLEQLGVGIEKKPIISEFAETALDLPLISLGLSKNIAKTLGEQGIKVAPKIMENILAKELSSLLPKGLKKPVSEITKPVTEKIGEIAEQRAIKQLTKGEQKAFDYAIDLTSPKLTKAVKEEAIAKGTITEPGIFKKSKITPVQKDNLIAESVQDVVSPKYTMKQNVDSINQKISQINSNVRNFVADNKVPFNTNQLKTKLDSGKNELKLVFTSDTTAEKTYNALIDEFISHVKGKDTAGLLDARQTFDKLPAVKKLLDTDKLGENARKEIALTIRRKANEYIADLLPTNNPYRDLLKQESRMIEALGNISEKNAKTIGKNKLQLLAEEYPILKWAVGGAVGAAGVGVGGAIIGSTD